MTNSFFDGVKQSFADVPVDAANGNIDTIAFLSASEEVVRLFGKKWKTRVQCMR
jgi:hypothetical protein